MKKNTHFPKKLLKNLLTNRSKCVIIVSEKGKTKKTILLQKENKKMKKNTQGWYTFADGTQAWFFGLSAQEKAREVRKHGKIVKFVPTNC